MSSSDIIMSLTSLSQALNDTKRGKYVGNWLDGTFLCIYLLVLDHFSPFQVHGIDKWLTHQACDKFMAIGLTDNWAYGSLHSQKVPIWSFWLQLSEKHHFLTQDVMHDTSDTP